MLSWVNWRGFARIKIKNYKGAIEDYSKAINIDKENLKIITIEVWQTWWFSWIYWWLWYFINLNPSHVKSLNLRGEAKVALNKYESAIANFQSLEIDPNNIYALGWRGRVKNKIFDYKGAIEDFSRALEINPQLFDAYRYRGDSKYFLKDYESAIGDYSKALEINPQLFDAQHFKGCAKYFRWLWGCNRRLFKSIRNRPKNSYA